MQLQHLYKGEKRGMKEMCTRRKQRNNASHDMRHIARALHTFGTQKHPLHVIHEKRKEKKKNGFRSSGACGISFSFLA